MTLLQLPAAASNAVARHAGGGGVDSSYAWVFLGATFLSLVLFLALPDIVRAVRRLWRRR